MKIFAMARKIDEIGRITLPIKIRRELGLEERENMESYADKKGYIIIKKADEDSKDVRRLDLLGRFTIPVDIRKHSAYNIALDEENDRIILEGVRITNADNVRSMSNEEMAKFINENAKHTENEIFDWLNENA